MDSLALATARVDAEDARVRQTRIMAYKIEIDAALLALASAKNAGKKSCKLVFGMEQCNEAKRIRETLIREGFACSELTYPDDGDWIQGFGPRPYIAIVVEFKLQLVA